MTREQKAKEAVVKAAMGWARAYGGRVFANNIAKSLALSEACRALARIQKEKKRGT